MRPMWGVRTPRTPSPQIRHRPSRVDFPIEYRSSVILYRYLKLKQFNNATIGLAQFSVSTVTTENGNIGPGISKSQTQWLLVVIMQFYYNWIWPSHYSDSPTVSYHGVYIYRSIYYEPGVCLRQLLWVHFISIVVFLLQILFTIFPTFSPYAVTDT